MNKNILLPLAGLVFSLAACSGDKPKAETAPAKSDPDGETVYAVQIFAVSKTMDPKSREFMGYTPRVIKSGTLNKYFIATGSSAAEVRKKLPAIRKKYPDAFLVKIVGDTVTRVD